MKKTKKVRPTAVAAFLILAMIMAVILWLFTPLGYFGVTPRGEYSISVTIGKTQLTATMENNTSAWAFHKMLERGPKTVHMRDYGDMEKVGMIGQSLPTNDESVTTEAGDLILYQGNSFVIYYAPNSWDFTRLGKIRNITASELKQVLGDGDVTVKLSID